MCHARGARMSGDPAHGGTQLMEGPSSWGDPAHGGTQLMGGGGTQLMRGPSSWGDLPHRREAHLWVVLPKYQVLGVASEVQSWP